MSWRRESNPQPTLYESAALPLSYPSQRVTLLRERDSNPHLRINSPPSCQLDHPGPDDTEQCRQVRAVGRVGIEPTTERLSVACSYLLSYRPGCNVEAGSDISLHRRQAHWSGDRRVWAPLPFLSAVLCERCVCVNAGSSG